jgi:hypothetical protein
MDLNSIMFPDLLDIEAIMDINLEQIMENLQVAS